MIDHVSSPHPRQSANLIARAQSLRFRWRDTLKLLQFLSGNVGAEVSRLTTLAGGGLVYAASAFLGVTTP
jgi:hypothetical protein